MLTALFADIHANLPALEACLRHARTSSAERYVFLGDIVGYGPEPAAVLDRIRAIEGAIVVQGNHDQAIEVEPKIRDLGDTAHEMVIWTRRTLSTEQKRYLAALPLMVRHDDCCFVHASAAQPGKWEYVLDAASARRSLEAAGTPYVFCGHVHDQTLYFKTPAGKVASFYPTSGDAVPVARRRGGLAIVGSVGQPRDRNPAAAYAMFDSSAEHVTFFRVPYDFGLTAARLRAIGLPVAELLAERIERAS